MQDDRRGVGETLDETMCGCRDCQCVGLIARGRHLVFMGPSAAAPPRARALQQAANDPAVLAAAVLPSPSLREAVAASRTKVFSGLQAALPDNVQLVTLMRLERGKVLVRLGHSFQVGGCRAAPAVRGVAEMLHA
jgi:alpha-mannosidase